MTEPRGRVFSGSIVISELRHELDRLFQEIMSATESTGAPGWVPPTDILELDEAILVLVELPGLEPDDVAVTLEHDRLRIEGRRRLTFPAGETRFHCLERREGSFRRQIQILQPTDTSRARARLHRGLLRIELPKLVDRRRAVREVPVERVDEDES